MIATVEALFDGKMFHPLKAIPLEPNSRVPITIESLPVSKKRKHPFLRQLAL